MNKQDHLLQLSHTIETTRAADDNPAWTVDITDIMINGFEIKIGILTHNEQNQWRF